MALWFQLRCNEERIGTVEIRRREVLDLEDQDAIQDAVSTYDVTVAGRRVGPVRHRYGDGAWRLLAIAAGLIADETQARKVERPADGEKSTCAVCWAAIVWDPNEPTRQQPCWRHVDQVAVFEFGAHRAYAALRERDARQQAGRPTEPDRGESHG